MRPWPNVPDAFQKEAIMTEQTTARAGAPTGVPMHERALTRRALALAAAAALVLAVAAPASATSRVSGVQGASTSLGAIPNDYHQTNLVSDIPGVARLTDPNLVNPWGMAAGPATPIWVSDNGSNVTTLYRGAIAGSALTPIPLVVGIPTGAPTGQVFNDAKNFDISSGKFHGPPLFIFATETGSITGWNPGVPAPAPSVWAQVGVTVPNAVYKGLAINTDPTGDFLYAANFRAGTIDVFNGKYKMVHWGGAFRDSAIPAGYAPFNIQNIGGRLYVTYAKQDAAKHDDVAGAGHGYVDVYDLRGHLLQRLASKGHLNSPWGLAWAPAGFGHFSGDLLVGNFGDGAINAYNPSTGHFDGQLRNEDGNVIAINGLWGLRFGDGVAGTPTTLFFTAGIGDESHGLMGTIESVH
jgi:uncharacterized protein (TIGR03118 family)